ncbi:hypothetical protein MBAV_001839 [Candidatus Magnetobacterium bavaricum]|uniref:Uncharacterized protein n=1 Tax=Candidatus Magnetobacterium bavaricum TaxID=29290 RepID=A0A0F3GVS8_9BACT|nr:hypothetical protein MBAV_001839 [Candidatus Magnetobacterium bavaricum]
MPRSWQTRSGRLRIVAMSTPSMPPKRQRPTPSHRPLQPSSASSRPTKGQKGAEPPFL